MKKIYTLFLIAASLTACQKSNSNNTTVRLEFNTNVSATYNISYTDQNNNPQSVTFTGNSWAKTIVAPGPLSAILQDYFIVQVAATPYHEITGTSTVTTNGKVTNSGAIDFTNGGSNNVSLRYGL